MTFEQGTEIISQLNDLNTRINNVTTTSTSGEAIEIVNAQISYISSKVDTFEKMMIIIMVVMLVFVFFNVTKIRGE